MPDFDLRTRFIPNDHSIWVLHAGRGKRQFRFFFEHSMVFLEIPGFNAAMNTFADLGAIRRHLRMSDAILRFATGADAVPPARNPQHYSALPDAENKGFNSAVGNVKSLYHEARPGDLVVVPGYGQYSPLLIGEILEGFDPQHTIALEQFNEELIPYRPVRWLKVDIEKREFSSRTSRRLENRHAIIRISELPNILEIYRTAYDNYIFRNTSKSTLYGREYDSKNPTGIIQSTQLLQYIFSAYIATEAGRSAEFSNLGIFEATREFYDPELVNEFTLNFNSPGKFDLIVGTAVAAIVVSLVVATAISNAPFHELVNHLTLSNSVGHADDATIGRVHDLYEGIMNSIGEDHFTQVQELSQDANENIGLETPMIELDE